MLYSDAKVRTRTRREMWGLSVVQGPFSVRPVPSNPVTIRITRRVKGVVVVTDQNHRDDRTQSVHLTVCYTIKEIFGEISVDTQEQRFEVAKLAPAIHPLFFSVLPTAPHLSQITTVNGNTVRSFSTHGQLSAAQGSPTTVSA